MNTCLVGCLSFAAYLLFAGTVSVNELITAVVLSVLTTIWAAVVRHGSRLRFSMTASAFYHLLTALIRLPGAVARTGGVLMKVAVQGGSPGQAEECAFRYGGAHARDRMRRACVVICASLAPDRFVVDLGHETDKALLHNILRHGRAPDPRWLE